MATAVMHPRRSLRVGSPVRRCFAVFCDKTNGGLVFVFFLISWLYVLSTHKLSQATNGLTKVRAEHSQIASWDHRANPFFLLIGLTDFHLLRANFGASLIAACLCVESG
jgi:hypothetical protein